MDCELSFRRHVKEIKKSIANLHTFVKEGRGNFPGMGLLEVCLEPNDIVNAGWLNLLHLEYSLCPADVVDPTVPDVELKFASDIRNVMLDEEGESTPFLTFKMYRNIERHVFKSNLVEVDKLKSLVDAELENNGNAMWPFFYYIYRTLLEVEHNYEFEVNTVSGKHAMLTVVDPVCSGYIEIDLYFNGSEESKLLEQIAEEE